MKRGWHTGWIVLSISWNLKVVESWSTLEAKVDNRDTGSLLDLGRLGSWSWESGNDAGDGEDGGEGELHIGVCWDWKCLLDWF